VDARAVTTVESTSERAEELLASNLQAVHARADKAFAVLLGGEWVFGVILALTVSPWAWAGKVSTVHVHVWAAVILGGLLSGLPIYLVAKRPGADANRYVVAVAQMLWSGLLIHLTGGRIETHFHVFGSLAFLAFYRDWKVLVPATIVVATDHLVRGMFWPESVYGILFPEWWRFLEHAFWVAFEDVVLVFACLNWVEDMRAAAERQAEVEALSIADRNKTQVLRLAMEELREEQGARVRTEKLAAVGQLAASVGHELRNPLAAVRNAATYITRRLTDPKFSGQAANGDAKIVQFLGVMHKELDASAKIISDLLDFARERKPSLNPCPLRPLVDDAFGVVPAAEGVSLVNEVSDDLPIPSLDKDQFRQILANLVQNAVEATAGAAGGQVTVRADGGTAGREWRIQVVDNGHGMAPEVRENVFQPLYTTKVKGTGLGLAIVANMVAGHGGAISVESDVGKGTTFTIILPHQAAHWADPAPVPAPAGE